MMPAGLTQPLLLQFPAPSSVIPLPTSFPVTCSAPNDRAHYQAQSYPRAFAFIPTLGTPPQRSSWLSPTYPLGLCTKFSSVDSTLTSSFKTRRQVVGGAVPALFFSVELITAWHLRHFTISYFNPLDCKLHERFLSLVHCGTRSI